MVTCEKHALRVLPQDQVQNGSGKWSGNVKER